MEIKGSLGNFIKTKRKALGLSQQDVSTKLGYKSGQFVSNWERGLSMPPASNLDVLAEIFKVNKETIVDLYMTEKRSRLL